MMTRIDPVTDGPVVNLTTGRSIQPVKASAGLRGVAAFTVLIYFYTALELPEPAASMSIDPGSWINMPTYLLRSGLFARAWLFVLSGLVMAAAVERYSFSRTDCRCAADGGLAGLRWRFDQRVRLAL